MKASLFDAFYLHILFFTYKQLYTGLQLVFFKHPFSVTLDVHLVDLRTILRCLRAAVVLCTAVFRNATRACRPAGRHKAKLNLRTTRYAKRRFITRRDDSFDYDSFFLSITRNDRGKPAIPPISS